MTKLIVTADIHGSYSSWLTIKSLLKPSDGLAVAGDLFDTRYGNRAHLDFQPESIREELAPFSHPFYYVYGNCDVPSFFPGTDEKMSFTAFNKKILLHHGHRPCPAHDDIDVIIQGHTHRCSLEKRGSRIFMNPGSITCPRNNTYTYGVIDRSAAHLVDLRSGTRIVSIGL